MSDNNGMKQWLDILDKMIYAFEIVAKDDIVEEIKNIDKINEGLALFAKHFFDLWD